MLKKACLAVVATALLAFGVQAAEKKTWQQLDGCRYVADKSNDGDSFLVQCGREKFFARLYFVDTPEADVSFPERVRQQYDYFGVTMDELTRAGARARERVQGMLAQKPFVLHTRKSFAQGRSKNTRYYSLVQVEGRYLHEILLGEGLARNKGAIVGLPTGEQARAHANTLQALEDRARIQRKGVWAKHVPANRMVKSPL